MWVQGLHGGDVKPVEKAEAWTRALGRAGHGPRRSGWALRACVAPEWPLMCGVAPRQVIYHDREGQLSPEPGRGALRHLLALPPGGGAQGEDRHALLHPRVSCGGVWPRPELAGPAGRCGLQQPPGHPVSGHVPARGPGEWDTGAPGSPSLLAPKGGGWGVMLALNPQSHSLLCLLQLQNQSELRAPTAEKAAFYLDAALAARSSQAGGEDGGQGSHLLFTLHVYQYQVEKCGQGGSEFCLLLLGVLGGRFPGPHHHHCVAFQCLEAAAACTSSTWAAVKWCLAGPRKSLGAP